MAYFLPDGRLVVDNSTLSTVATCGTQAVLKYGLNLQPPVGTNMPAESGTALHGATEQYFITGKRHAAFDYLEEHYQPLADRFCEPDDRLGYNNIEKCLDSWFKKYGPGELPYTVEPGSVEVPFALPLTEHIVYAGRIDALVRPREGAGLWLLDTKSTGKVDRKFKDQFKIGSQMSGYYWAAQQVFGETPVGIYINVVHTGKVPSSDRKCAKHGMKYAECGGMHMQHAVLQYYRTPEEIEDWLADAKVIATEWLDLLRTLPGLGTMHNIDQRGKWIYQACTLCDYHDYCQLRRPPRYARQHFVEREWIPGGVDEMEEFQ